MPKFKATFPKPYIRLMYGDNGEQQFYESYKGEILILKIHGEIIWSVFINGTWKKSTCSFRKALFIANEKTPYKPIIDKEYIWIMPHKGNRMQLVRKEN